MEEALFHAQQDSAPRQPKDAHQISDARMLSFPTHPQYIPTEALTDAIRVSVVIPTLNEAQNLAHVLPLIPTWVHEVIIVDGHSTDDTVAVARSLLPTAKIVMQQGKGKGAALRCGFRSATGDIIVHLDADGSTDPTEIPAFVGALLAGADYAKGSRFLQGAGTIDMTPLHKLGNTAFVWIANLLFGTSFSDITYGYNAFWRRHCEALALEIDNWAHEIIGNIRVARRGLHVVEIACYEHERIAGAAKLATFSAGWQILKAMIAERCHRVEPWEHRRPARSLPSLPLVPVVTIHEHRRSAGQG